MEQSYSNRFRSRFKWILWRVNISIIFINGVTIDSLHYRQNHSTSFGRIGSVFEGSLCKFYVPFYFWIIWLITINEVELVHLSSKNISEELGSADDTGLIIVFNASIALATDLLSKT